MAAVVAVEIRMRYLKDKGPQDWRLGATPSHSRYFFQKVNFKILDFVLEGTDPQPLTGFAYKREEKHNVVDYLTSCGIEILCKKLECQHPDCAFPWVSLGEALITLCVEWFRNLLVFR